MPIELVLPSSHLILCHPLLLLLSIFSSIINWSEVTQSCPTLCNPTDCSLPGSSVHGIFQAKTLEWVAISFSRRSSWLRDWTRVSRIVGRRLYHLSHQGSLSASWRKGNRQALLRKVRERRNARRLNCFRSCHSPDFHGSSSHFRVLEHDSSHGLCKKKNKKNFLSDFIIAPNLDTAHLDRS